MEQAEPVTEVSTVDAIKGILTGNDNPEPVQSEGEDDRPAVQEPDAGGDDSSGGSVDEPQSASDEGVLDDTEGGEEEIDDAPVTLKELAAHLELEPSDVYDVEIPVGKGETATLGQMKDAYKEYGSVHEYKERVEKKESDLERELLATRAHLNRILPLIPQENARAIMDHASESNKVWNREQESMVLEAIPDWKDATTRTADRQGIVEQLAAYGFTQAEVEYTKDARMQRYMRDMYVLQKEVSEMRTSAKKKVSTATAPGKRKVQSTKQRKLAQALRRAKESTNVSDKRAAVAQLIGR